VCPLATAPLALSCRFSYQTDLLRASVGADCQSASQPASQPATHTHTHTHTHSQPAAQSRRLAVAIPSPCASDHRYELQRPFVEALQRLSWGYAVLQPRLRLQHQR
jgi:hypothetical protein